eukprot:Em0015g497a
MMADRAYPKWSTDQRLELVRDQFIQGVQSSSTQLRLMKEMPKTVEEAVTLATQLEAIEAAQKKLCRQRTQESLAVERDTKPWDGEDSEESLAAAVKRTDNVPMVEKLRRQVEDSEKLVHQLKRQLQQLQLDQGHARQDAPARGFGHNVYRSAPQTTHISSKVRYVGTVRNGDRVEVSRTFLSRTFQRFNRYEGCAARMNCK